MTCGKDGILLTQVTKHAARRIHERLGIPLKSVERVAQLAFENGVERRHTTGGLRRYLDALWWGDTPKDGIVVYHRTVYIFDKGILVTVLPLPKRYYAEAKKLLVGSTQ